MYHLIVNTSGGSGGTRKTWQQVKKLLDERRIDYRAYRTTGKGSATRIAAKLTALPDKRVNIIVVGGDGTINEVLNGIRDFEKVRLGLIPSGSGNDFARGVGIPKNTTASLERILAAGDGRRIDIGQLEIPGARGETSKSRFFGISSGIGLDAIVCKRAMTSKIKVVLNHLGLGRLTYIIITVLALFTMKTYRMRLIVKQDGKSKVFVFPKMIFSAGMNLRAEGGGVRMAPFASARDGKLSLCTAFGIPRIKAFFLLPLLSMGKHEGKKGFFLYNAQQLEMITDKPMVVHADGEYMGDHKNVRLRALPGKLHVLA